MAVAPPKSLDQWMSDEGLDDFAVAEILKTDRTTVSRIRRGKARPSWDLAAAIKDMTGGTVVADSFLPTRPSAPQPPAAA